ncbi:MAG: Ig-like domain-containing protein, partial [Myxococcota bacterium]
MNRPIWKRLAVAMAVGLSACGDSDNNNADANANALELVNPIPGTEIQLVTEDGQNHGPAQRVTLENAGNLTVPVGEMIVLRAMVVFGDGYMADVTEHTYFQVTGEGLNLSPRTDAGVPASGFAEGIAKISLLLGSLAQPTIDVAVTPALLKTLVISAPSAEVPRNGTLALTVSGTYGDGTTLDVSTVATWSSSDDSTATVTNSGVVAGVADGGVTISA